MEVHFFVGGEGSEKQQGINLSLPLFSDMGRKLMPY